MNSLKCTLIGFLILLLHCNITQAQSIGSGLETPACFGNVVYFTISIYDNDSWGLQESEFNQKVSKSLLESNLLPVNINNESRRPDNCSPFIDKGTLSILVSTFHNTSQVRVTYLREVYYKVSDNDFKRTLTGTTFNHALHGYSDSKNKDSTLRMLDQSLENFVSRYKSANNIR